MGVFDWLFGAGTPTTPYAPAPSASHFPTQEDAEYAKRAGFGYESPHSSYIEGNTAKVMGGPDPHRPYLPGDKPGLFKDADSFHPKSASGLTSSEAADPSRATNLDLTNPANAAQKKKLENYYMLQALAANRIPLSALGFDPSHATVDTSIGPNSTLGGAYSRSKDHMWVNGQEDPASSMVHESIHRGLNMLRSKPELRGAFERLPSEESVVRYLMATQGGDPEGKGGEIDKQQREAGLYVMDKALGSGGYQKALEQLTKAAQEEIAKRKPGGPN